LRVSIFLILSGKTLSVKVFVNRKYCRHFSQHPRFYGKIPFKKNARRDKILRSIRYSGSESLITTGISPDKSISVWSLLS